ncbi:MAG: FliA/WhiG family RNA polymerase sigma factor [Burkholderiaceae bacterium]
MTTTMLASAHDYGELGAYAELKQAARADLGPDFERRQLVQYAPLVKRIVRQLNAQASAVMDREDMEQIGLMGLLEALRRYGEPDEAFGAFAALRVRGAILDELRRQDWRPRSVRQDSHRIRDALRALTRKLGHQPSEAEILEHLKLSPKEWSAYQQADVAEELASFDELVSELSNQPSEARTPEAQLMVTRSLAQALTALDAREQKVIQLYYEFDASLKEIAAVLDLTEARVSQINKAALRKMKTFLQQD